MDILRALFSQTKKTEWSMFYEIYTFIKEKLIIRPRKLLLDAYQRQYDRHVSHCRWRMFEKYCESVMSYLVEVWPNVFIFLIALLLSYALYRKIQYQRKPVQYVRGKYNKPRGELLFYELEQIINAENIFDASVCLLENNNRLQCCLLDTFEDRRDNNFQSSAHCDTYEKITFGGSSSSLFNKTNKDIVEEEGLNTTITNLHELDDTDVLNETIPQNRMRRESVCAEAYDPELDLTYLKTYKPHIKNHFQKQFLLDSLREVFPFYLLENDQLDLVLNAMFQRRVTQGEVIISEGDDGDFFYVIERGSYVVSVLRGNKQKILKTYHNKGCFGELALMYNTRRAATVKAAVDGVVWCLDRLTFKSVIAQTAHQRRIMNESLLRSLPLLSHLPKCDILSLSDALIRREFDDGELIIQQGSVPDGMYFIRKGDVRIIKFDEFGGEKEIQILSAGDYFGERALITRGKREASVLAKGHVELEFLNVDTFERLLGPCVDNFKEKIALQDKLELTNLKKYK